MKRILLIVLALLWAPSFLVIKVGLDMEGGRGIPPLMLAAGRVVIAAVLLVAMARLGGERFPRTWDFWRRFAIMGFLANALPFAMLMWGETIATSALAAIFNGFTPVVTTVLAHFTIAEERMTGRTLVGMLLGVGGLLCLFLPSLFADDAGGGGDPILGMIAFLVMAISYGFSTVYSRKALRGYPRYVGPAAQLSTAALMLLPFAVALEWDDLVTPSPIAIGALLWLSIVATALAYVVYYRMLEIAGATYLSLVTFLVPTGGVLLGVIVLDESLEWNALLGCAMVLLGVAFVREREG